MKVLYMIGLFMLSFTEPAQAISFQSEVAISTPGFLYHGHNCSVMRFHLNPDDASVSEFQANCGYTVSSPPVFGHESSGKVRFVRVQLLDINLDRNDCVFVDQSFYYPSMNIEIECGWSYGEILLDGFDSK